MFRSFVITRGFEQFVQPVEKTTRFNQTTQTKHHVGWEIFQAEAHNFLSHPPKIHKSQWDGFQPTHLFRQKNHSRHHCLGSFPVKMASSILVRSWPWWHPTMRQCEPVGMQEMRIPRVIWCLDSNLKWRNSMAHHQFFNGNLGRCSTLTDPGQFWIQPSTETKPSTDWRPTVTTIELLSSEIRQQLDHWIIFFWTFCDIHVFFFNSTKKNGVSWKNLWISPFPSISQVQRPWRGPLPAFRHVLDKPSWPKDDATGFRPPKNEGWYWMRTVGSPMT